MNFKERTEKFIKARENLPEELHDIYTQLVDEYAYHTLLLHGKKWVVYDVIAALAKSGWRPSEKTDSTKR